MSNAQQLDQTRATTELALPLLTPSAVRTMLRERQRFQVMKFRTTCSDCVPNL